MMIRRTQPQDLPELLAIYNDEVENGVATFDLVPKSVSEWDAWFAAHPGGKHVVLSAIEEGHAVGYASLSRYRDRGAFDSTVELSVYVARAHRRKGIATALMREALRIAQEEPTVHSVVSVITGGNLASVRLHERFGFSFCGCLHQVGFKHGAYRDVLHYERLV